MIKFVYCVRKKPELSDEEFFRYWKENHGPLVKSFAKTLHARRYVQSHTIETYVNDVGRQFRGTKPAYDGITEVWWDSVEDLAAVLQTPEGKEANKSLIEDEARFCDLSQSCVFLTEEHEIFDRPAD